MASPGFDRSFENRDCDAAKCGGTRICNPSNDLETGHVRGRLACLAMEHQYDEVHSGHHRTVKISFGRTPEDVRRHARGFVNIVHPDGPSTWLAKIMQSSLESD